MFCYWLFLLTCCQGPIIPISNGSWTFLRVSGANTGDWCTSNIFGLLSGSCTSSCPMHNYSHQPSSYSSCMFGFSVLKFENASEIRFQLWVPDACGFLADSSKPIQAAHGSWRQCFVPPLLLQLLPVWDVMPDPCIAVYYLIVIILLRWQLILPKYIMRIYLPFSFLTLTCLLLKWGAQVEIIYHPSDFNLECFWL